MVIYDLKKLVRRELKVSSRDLATRGSGESALKLIEDNLMNEVDSTVIAVDFSGVGIIDYSSADEIGAKLISRLLGSEYGNRYIIFTGLNENQRENLDVALERKGLSAVAEMRDGERILLGTLTNYLKQTLDLVNKNDKITSKDVSELIGIEANTSGTRLLNLHKKRLVRRIEEIRNGGRVWVYERIESG